MHTPPEMILAQIVVVLILVSGVCMLVLKYINWREHMSRPGVRSVALEPSAGRRFSAVSRAEINPETTETRPSVAEIEAEKIHFAETETAQALARLVIAEKIGLTDAVKIGADKKSGEGYQKWSRLVKAAIEEQRQQPTPIAQRPTSAHFAGDKAS